MWSSLFCLSMIRHYVPAAMICSLTVSAASPTPVLAPADAPRLPLLGDGWSVWLNRAVLVCVCVCYTMRGTMVIWWRKRGYLCILRWKVSLPSLYVCACVHVSVWASVHGHVAVGMLRWQMALLQCWATLANRGRTGRRWERRRKSDVSQRRCGWGLL